MVNLRSKSKAKSTVPDAALKREATGPTPPTVLDNSNLSEETLRKLPRAELQKLAMLHKVKANMKSELIIQQLASFRVPKKTRPAQDYPEEGTSRKRPRREAVSAGVSISLKSQNHVKLPGPTTHAPAKTGIEDHQPPDAGLSVPSPVQRMPTKLSYDKDLFSGTESEVTEEEQPDFTAPVSSRLGTPPPANVINLEHCVTVMQQISTQDVALLKEVVDVRDVAAKLRRRANDVRNLVQGERGRRERVEAYFRYWQEMGPRWDRKWLYGEKMAPDHKVKLDDLDEHAEPPTVPTHQYDQEAQNFDGGRHERPAKRKPALSPEELKRMREAIVSRQEAEQRELEALCRDELRFRSRNGVDATTSTASS